MKFPPKHQITIPKPSLQDKQEIKLAGCGDKCPTFIVLPQVGSVTLGQGPGEQYLSPARSVNFGYRLLAAKTETTVAQWRHFMQQSGYKLPANNTTHCDWQKEAVSEQHPVRCISAEDADAYAHWLHTTYAPALPGKAQVIA
ncbi:MAG: SUMF1/EgtB/PvdO family nonheme iron enzyme [Ideonella sp.]|nr:SUMF1/EgtB/PvdO family nonheme iron enzyme [Ideonella sp.]